ncbi:hypothetical protein Tco_0352693 [Tanacetum coccineum]
MEEGGARVREVEKMRAVERGERERECEVVRVRGEELGSCESDESCVASAEESWRAMRACGARMQESDESEKRESESRETASDGEARENEREGECLIIEERGRGEKGVRRERDEGREIERMIGERDCCGMAEARRGREDDERERLRMCERFRECRVDGVGRGMGQGWENIEMRSVWKVGRRQIEGMDDALEEHWRLVGSIEVDVLSIGLEKRRMTG